MRRAISIMLAGTVLLGFAGTAALALGTPPFPDWATPIVGRPFVGVITTQTVVALTIDDVRTGPLGRTMADAIVSHGLRGTYFCVSSELATEDAQYSQQLGIEMGDHGWTHVGLSTMSAAEASKTLNASAERLYAMTGVWPLWYRSPYLEFGPNGPAQIADAGMLEAGVGVNPHDYTDGMTPEKIAATIAANLRPGAVYGLHVLPNTLAAVPLIAEVLEARGYTTVTMSELATVGPPARTADDLWKAPTVLSAPVVVGMPKNEKRFAVSGKVGPASKRTVSVRVYTEGKHGKTKLLKRLNVTSNSRGGWSKRLTLKRGRYRIRVIAPVTRMYAMGTSDWTRIRVH